MHPIPASHPGRRTPPVVLSVLLTLLLPACGGGDPDTPLATTPAPAAAAAPKPGVPPPLLDARGQVRPSPRAAVPVDHGAWTRQARYATEAQAQRLERAMGAATIGVRVEPDTGDTGMSPEDLAVMSVYAMQAGNGLDPRAPVLVRGDDLRQAAAVVDRLTAAGFTRVFLVTR